MSFSSHSPRIHPPLLQTLYSAIYSPVFCFQWMGEVFPLLWQGERKAILMAVLFPVFLWFWCAVALHLKKNKTIKVCLHRLCQQHSSKFKLLPLKVQPSISPWASVFYRSCSNVYLAVTGQHRTKDIWWPVLLCQRSECWHCKAITSSSEWQQESYEN